MSTAVQGSIFVGDLHADVDETTLYTLFSQAGPVRSVKICRDAHSRRPLGHAYVNFDVATAPNAAEAALNQFNYHNLLGQQIRTMYANRDPSSRVNLNANVFIKNLDKAVTSRDLDDTFSEFGRVLSCKVMTDPAGNSKGHGFVQFANVADAERAIAEVNGMTLGDSDKVVTVCKFKSRRERVALENFTNLFVKNLPESVKTEAELTEMFSEHGKITSAAIYLNEKLQKYFGFVNFESSQAAAAALAAMNNKVLDGVTLFVNRAQSKAERSSMLKKRHLVREQEQQKTWEGRNVYVKNLPKTYDEDALRSLFQGFGEIANVKVMRHSETKIPRGFGFVCYKTVAAADAAVASMNGQPLEGRPPLYVAKAIPRALRAATSSLAQKTMSGSNPSGEFTMESSYMGGVMGSVPTTFPVPMGTHLMPNQTAFQPALQPLHTNGSMMNQLVPWNAGLQHTGSVLMHPGAMGGMMTDMAAYNSQAGARNRPYADSCLLTNGMQTSYHSMGNAHSKSGSRPYGRRGWGRREGHGFAKNGANGSSGSSGGTIKAVHEKTLSEEDKRQKLGELLYPKILAHVLNRESEDRATNLALKITGMLLEMGSDGLTQLLSSETDIQDKVAEGLEVLRVHSQTQALAA